MRRIPLNSLEVLNFEEVDDKNEEDHNTIMTSRNIFKASRIPGYERGNLWNLFLKQ
jgi:hypothetical protein